jgi:hypothetical protein
MANWGPYGSQGELFAVQNKFAPPAPEGVPWPANWGIEENVQELLGPYASSLRLERKTVHFAFDSFEHAMQTFGSAGPGVAQREQMSPESLQEMASGAFEVVQRHNKATDGSIALDAEYLQVVARKRG